MNKNLLLTSEQQKIIDAEKDKNIRIIAGAGCAKTTTILYRIKHLIEYHSIDPESIILTTFTKDASLDMESKLKNLIDFKIIIGTIDSISKKYVDKYAKKVETKEQQKNIYVGEYKVKFHQFLQDTNNPNNSIFFKQIRYLFIDEYQDINQYYYNIILEMYKNGVIISVVGDDAQNIYTWNGSKIEYILKFQQEFNNTESFFLTQNFRSTPEILELANQSINKNEHQIHKIISSNIDSIKVKPSVNYYYSWDREYIGIKTLIDRYIQYGFRYHDIAILSRNCTDNGPLYFLETNLARDKLPTVLLEGNKDVRSKIKEDHICLSTIHKSKGLEWSIVFIIGCDDKFFPSGKDDDKIEEERRLFYVGVTRPKYYLHLSLSSSKSPILSRFITELDPNLFQFINTQHLSKSISNVEPKYLELSVVKLIENLKTEHYIELREQNILPELDWDCQEIYSEKSYHNFILNQELFTDFGIFLDSLISRQIGDIDKSSSGKIDYNANKVIAKIVVNYYQYNIYKLYKANFVTNLKYIDNITNPGTIIKILESNKTNNNSNDWDYIKTIDRNHYEAVMEIIDKMRYNSIKYQLPIEDIPIFVDNLLPVDFIQEMENSYLKYTNKLTWDQIVFDVYKVSRSQNILKGRSKILYTAITYDDINSYQELYNQVYNNYVKHFCQGKKNYCKPNFNHMGVYGEIDAICNNTIVDYKNSCQKNIQIEHVIQLLLYVVICQKNGIEIDSIRIFNPIKGLVYTAVISKWTKQDQLFNFVLKIRQEIMDQQKNKFIQREQLNSINIDTSSCQINNYQFLED